MALSGTGVFECRGSGNDSNAGYFNPGGASAGTDWSQQDAPQFTIDGALVTAAVHTTTTQLNIVGAVVSAAWIRNGLRISGGTATLGLYEITAVDTLNNRITVDRAAGTAAQTATGRVGGALQTPQQMAVFATVGGMVAHWRDNVTITTSTPGLGGPLVLSQVRLIGYGTTRYDGTKPIFSAGAVTGVNLISLAVSTFAAVEFVAVDGENGAGNTGIVASSQTNQIKDCDIADCPVIGASALNATLLRRVKTLNCGIGISGVPNAERCAAYLGTTGYSVSGNASIDTSIASGCSGVGFSSNSGRPSFYGCIADGCGGNGFSITGFGQIADLDECVSTNNVGNGYNLGVTNEIVMRACVDFGNAARISPTNWRFDYGAITLTADPWEDSDAADYRLNDVAGGGAVLRGDALPIPGQVDNRDIGAVQHTATSNVVIIKRGIL